MLRLTLKQLETFVAVAECRGFRRAAERLNLSQSAVTAHVQILEQELGVPLFHRTTRSVRLTEAGLTLLNRAQGTLSEIEDVVRLFRDEAAMERGRVLIACAPSFASSLLPGILAEFEARHPNVIVQVRELYGSEILDSVRGETADFGIGPLEREHREFEFRHLFSDRFCAVVSRRHPLAGKRRARFDDIIAEPILAMPRKSANRDQLEDIFAARGLTLTPRYEMLHHQTLIAMAEAGLGVAVVPDIAVPAGAGYRAVPLTRPEVKRRMGIITLRGQSLAPAASAFTDVTARVVLRVRKRTGAENGVGGRSGSPTSRTAGWKPLEHDREYEATPTRLSRTSRT